MNMLEFCERFKISLVKARKMDKAGVLRLEENTNETALDMILALRNGDPLSAAQLCELAENRGLLLDLGRYAGRAESQLAGLGDARGEAAPKEVAAYITDASKGDPESVAILCQWIKSVVPAHPVGHSYLAARLLLGLAPSVRKYDIPRVSRALLECRKSDDLAGWHSTKEHKGRNMSFYCRPTVNELANLDL
jgi:hypothetical protein